MSAETSNGGSAGTSLLAVRDAAKSFPGVQAVRGVSLQVKAGEVLGLIGENGAGKSTLIKIIGGIHPPDAGELLIDGRAVQFRDASDSIAAGIAIIHQELNLADNMSVEENIFLGRQPTIGWPPLGLRDRRALRDRAADALQQIALDLHPGMQLSDLSPGQKQLVEIAKALSQDARLLIFDEPTSSLTQHEAEVLFNRIEELRQRGIGIIYVSHRLGEIMRLCSRVQVLRDGRSVGELTGELITHDNMVRLMIGRESGARGPRVACGAPSPRAESARKPRAPHSADAPLLRVRNLRLPCVPHEISFHVHAGEVVGIGGLVGAGRTEVLRALFGIDPIESGVIEVSGQRVRIRSPRDAIAAGLTLAPEERKTQGLVLEMSIGANISLAVNERLAQFGLADRGAETAVAQRQADELRVRAPTLAVAARNLSGGNQQKVVLAKWLAVDGKVLMLDEPTRGVDVGAKEEIYQIIRQLAAAGRSVLMVSSEMEELIALSDRVLVMHEGRLAGELSGEQITSENIMTLAVGGNLS